MTLPRNKLEDVWKFIEKKSDGECWPWTGSRLANGYGTFCVNYIHYKAHRIVYHLTKSPIQLIAPKDIYAKGFVLHTCDNRQCCNPDHLYLGDIRDNMKDMVQRNRQSRLCGEDSPVARLTNSDVERIREASLFGAKRKDLAAVYGVSYETIRTICRGETYRVSRC
jgi:hypothetical protein